MEHFGEMQLPDAFTLEEDSAANGLQEMDAGTNYSANKASVLSKKRKMVNSSGDPGSDGESDNKAPARDIYRDRQQKRVR